MYVYIHAYVCIYVRVCTCTYYLIRMKQAAWLRGPAKSHGGVRLPNLAETSAHDQVQVYSSQMDWSCFQAVAVATRITETNNRNSKTDINH